ANGAGGVAAPYAIAAPPVAGDNNAAHWTAFGPTNLDAALIGLPVTNNDVLVVRSTLANAQSVYVSAIADGTDNFNVNVPGTLAVGQIAVISDCYKAVVFHVTAVG